ncbi:MAG: hypothetical protein ACRCYU_14940 [Nocardioides sp.]
MGASELATQTPTWLGYVEALTTTVAVIFTAWAAWSAKVAADASREIGRIESERDERVRRSVVVDLALLPPTEHPTPGYVVKVTVINGSPYPVRAVRLKVVCGTANWGPQLLGPVTPGGQVVMKAFLPTPLDPIDNADAFVRFVDHSGEAWVSTARSVVSPAGDDVQKWIQEGEEWARSPVVVTPWMRGEVEGTRLDGFDLEAWMDAMVRKHRTCRRQGEPPTHSGA